MDRITKIGRSEIFALTLVYTGTKILLGIPRSFIEIAGTAGWMLPILSGLISLMLWFFVAKLLERFPGKSIMKINEEVAGPLFGTGLNIFLIIYLIVSSGNLLRLFSESVIVSALPAAPISSVAFLFLVPMVIAVYLGLEPIIRCMFISLPFIVFGTTGILFALIPFWDFTQIFPLFGEGLPKILTYSLPLTSVFGEVGILAILAPYFSFDGQKIRQVGFQCIILLSLFFSLSTLVYEIVIPYPGSIESYLPFYQMGRSIYLGRFFQRVESVFILFWTFSAFLRLAIGLFVGTYIYKEIFKVPYLLPLVPAMAITYLSLALTPTDLMHSVELERYRLLVGSLFTFGIPIGTLVLALLRGKGAKHEQAQKQD